MKTEHEIVEMAFAMFLQKGFSEISTNEIIREAGLTKGGFYYSFKSREDLDQRVIERFIRPYFWLPLKEMQQVWEEKAQNLSTEDLLWEGFFQPQRFAGYCAHIGQEIVFRDFYFLLYEGMKKFPQVIAYSKDSAVRKEQFLRRILERGKLRKEIKDSIDIENCVTMLLAMQDGILALKVLDEEIDDEEKYKAIQRQVWKDISTAEHSNHQDGGVISAVS